MSASLAYLNGRFIPRDDACLPIHDAGLVFGAAVTDFCRTFRHQLYRWPDHLRRFRHDCSVCFIPLLPGDEDLTGAAQELVAHNAGLIEPHQELALVSFATPGPFGFYASAPGPSTLCMHTAVLPFERYRPFFEHGVSLGVVGVHAASAEDLAPPSVKHRSRLHWWRADRLLRERGDPAMTALLTDGAGHVTETAIGNLLVVRDGVVRTPPRGQVLAGVSLAIVEELCQQLGIPFAEGALNLAACHAAEEAMLCGSAFCLAGVRAIAGQKLSWPGPITLRLLAAWSEGVGRDIAGQFLSSR